MKSFILWPQQYLDRTPMYMVVLHALVLLYVAAVVASVWQLIGFSPFELILHGVVVIGTALIVSVACSAATKVPVQHLSSLITALIIALLVLPSSIPSDLFASAAIVAIAIASKYVLIYKKQHVLNPVAAGTVIGSLLGFGGAAWWSANPVLFLPLLIGGLFVVAKVRRFSMVITFVAVSFGWYMVSSWNSTTPTIELVQTFFLSYPHLFLAFFMLTEPFTMPAREGTRTAYAAVVGTLASLPSLAGFVVTPELALLIGNILFVPYRLHEKLILTLQSIREVAPRTFEATFTKPSTFRFVAGQYLEWMLPHSGSDSRGIRRYFTITSAPEESLLRLSYKVPAEASTFKRTLTSLSTGGVVYGSQLAGDFVLPHDVSQKIGWIAGGIGVTPFVSQAKSMVHQGESREVTLFYCTNTAADAAYLDDLVAVAKVVNVVATGDVPPMGESGYLSDAMIQAHTPDFLERVWYVSGPPMMVDKTVALLRRLGVPSRQIKQDFFPGLA
jgi:ferredoxin-NADP reductase/Na+-translocating ferredoxin:NAD+ oxidoreductase RnfD subunit